MRLVYQAEAPLPDCVSIGTPFHLEGRGWGMLAALESLLLQLMSSGGLSDEHLGMRTTNSGAPHARGRMPGCWNVITVCLAARKGSPPVRHEGGNGPAPGSVTVVHPSGGWGVGTEWAIERHAGGDPGAEGQMTAEEEAPGGTGIEQCRRFPWK